MRLKVAFLGLVVALLVAACASTSLIEGEGVQARAGNALARAEIALTKGYRLVQDQAQAGVLLKSEVSTALETLDRAAKAVDEARKLYSLGGFDDALKKVLDADGALIALEAEIAKKLRERRPPVALSQSAAEEQCTSEMFRFLTKYHYLKTQGLGVDDIVSLLQGGSSAVLAAAEKFIRADFKGDRDAADVALTEAYKLCVQSGVETSV